MSWDAAESSKLGVDESTPGSGAYGDWITLNAGEKCLYTVVRDDATPGDRWLVSVEKSTDGARAESPASEIYMFGPTELSPAILIGGAPHFRVHIQNVDSSPSDTVTTDHYWVKDGINF